MLTLVALAVVASGSSSFVDGDVYIAGVFGAAVAALITGGVTYLVKRRGTSGNVKNSDADTIFKEGDKIRTWLTETLEKERTERAEEREIDQKTISDLSERSLNDRREIAKQERQINVLENLLRANGIEVPT